MPTSTLNSAYPASVEALLPKARRLAARLGEVPSRNRLMREYRIGSPKATALHEALTAERSTPAATGASRPADGTDDASTNPAAADGPAAADIDSPLAELEREIGAAQAAAAVAALESIPLDVAAARAWLEKPPLDTAPVEAAPADVPATEQHPPVVAAVATGPAAANGHRTPPPAVREVTPEPALTPEANGVPSPRPRGTGPFYLVAVAATLVSVDTSWRFFDQVLGITNTVERVAMFGVVELALVACGYAMRANVRRPGGTPGPARLLAWALCGLAGYMALALSGPVEGLARVALGPVLGLVALHLALGIEVRVQRGARTGTWARIGAELRERALSRLGLADDARTALARTRDRAADRAARLATGRHTPLRRRRLGRAVRVSGAALDPAQRDRVVTQVAALRHLDDLVNTDRPSPW